jgi:hypothetical protein
MNIPFKIPFLDVFFNNLLNPYDIGRNRRGERGNPCLRPLSGMKKEKTSPLIRTTQDIEVMQLITHTTN